MFERDSGKQLLEMCPCTQVCLLLEPGINYAGAYLEEKERGSAAGRPQIRRDIERKGEGP